jgi:hypothetical protein
MAILAKEVIKKEEDELEEERIISSTIQEEALAMRFLLLPPLEETEFMALNSQ